MLLCPVRNQEKGFTLLEIVVVVIIIGIISAIAAPNLLGLFSRNRVIAAMGEVEGALREAQKQAIRNGRSCSITINGGGVFNPAGGNGCLLNNRVLNDPNNASLIVLNSNRIGNDITFSGKGNITIDGPNPMPVLVVSLPNGTNEQRCVVIQNTLGSIRTGDYVGNPAGVLDPNNCQQIN